jgi:DNA-binding response OmpR family regulator
MQSPRILVVEDDPAICVLVEAILSRRNYACEIVHNGNDAIRLLRGNVYSAVLLDLMLPGVFGFDVIRFVHAERPWMASRVIVMTAACADTLRDFDHSSVRKLLRKPVALEELVREVEACVALDKPLPAQAPCSPPI